MNLNHNKSRTEYDKDGNLLPKQLLVKLMLNRSTEKLQPNPNTINMKQDIIIKGFNNPRAQIVEDLDFDEHLLLCASQPVHLDKVTREKFIKSHYNLEIHDDTRKQFILLFSDASYNLLTNANYYTLILKEVSHYPASYFSSIEKDICRTFGEQNQLQQKLRNVLCAYAIRNPRLLYCQGLNYLVAYFLINDYSEAEAFWILTQLVQEILPVDYYVDMGAVISLSSILTDLLREVMHGFIDYCEKIGLQTSFFLVPWLICLYTKGFSSSLSNFVMESIVIEREVALVKTAITLLKVCEPKIEECEDFGSFMRQLEVKVASVSVKEFKNVYDSLYINRYFFRVLLDNYLREYWDRAQNKQIENALNHKNALPMCHPQLPVCLHVVEINRKFRNISEVDTFRLKRGLDAHYDNNYFNSDRFDGNPVPNCKDKYFKRNIDDLLIGRHAHICIRETIQNRQSIPKKQNKLDIEKMIRQIIDDEEMELQDFQEKILRKTNPQRLDNISSIFQIVEDFETESFDMIEAAVEEKKESKVSKKESTVRLPDRIQSNSLIQWFKKLF